MPYHRMNLTIDIGNTTTKLGVFNEDKLVCFQRCDGYGTEHIKSILGNYHITDSIVSSTKELTKELKHSLETTISNGMAEEKSPTVFLSYQTPIPITNLYESPETLGMDRLAAVIGAYSIKPNNDILVIDAGTAITYDLLTAAGEYVGGNISPGIEMRFKALNEFTSKLPLVSQEERETELGKDTRTAIRCGVIDGVKYEIEGYIRDFMTKYPTLLIFLTGGNEFDFEDRIKKRTFADKYLVLRGLNRILTHLNTNRQRHLNTNSKNTHHI